MLRISSAATAALFLSIAPAFAHTGAGPVTGLAAGFIHPIGGLDHLLAMVAVGVLAAQIGGRALWAVPLAFVAMMLVGGIAGIAGGAMPLVELGIVGSVVILGAVIALGRMIAVPTAMALVGVLALFHGHAHGTEMPAGSNTAVYAAGFVFATALLHAGGIASARAMSRLSTRYAAPLCRTAGAMTALAGLALAAG